MKRAFSVTPYMALLFAEEPDDAQCKSSACESTANIVFSCAELVHRILIHTSDASSFRALAATNRTCAAIAALPSVQSNRKAAFMRYGKYTDKSGREKRMWRLPNWTLVGQCLCFHKSGLRSHECYYVDGHLDGLETRWRKTGEKKSIKIYRMGRLNGLATMWYRSGERVETMYSNDKRHGLHTTWYASGVVHRSEMYLEGRVHGMAVAWYESGELRGQVTYDQGAMHGWWIMWYESGQKRRQCFYENGLMHGIMTEWDERGNKRESVYSCGVLQANEVTGPVQLNAGWNTLCLQRCTDCRRN